MAISDKITEKLDGKIDWEFFIYWLGDESYFGTSYREAFQEHLETDLTNQQIVLIERMGRNLENRIGTWKTSNPNISWSCLVHKIYEYLSYQLNKPNIKLIIGEYC
jgi:hypothetical protein